MAWTTPKTWVDGNVLTAAELNEQVRDNLTYLFSKPSSVYKVDEAADYSTTSTVFVDVDSTNLSRTITTGGGDVAIWFSGSLAKSANTNAAFLDVLVNGSRYAADDGLIYAYGTTEFPFSFWILVTGLAANTPHTFKLQWKVLGGGSVAMRAGAGTTNRDVHPQFGVREL